MGGWIASGKLTLTSRFRHSREIIVPGGNATKSAIRAASLLVFLAYCVFSQSAASPQAKAPSRDTRRDGGSTEAVGWDQVIAGLLSAFDSADVVGVQATRGLQGSDLRLRLIRHPDFPNKAQFIVVEWGNSLYQPLLDRYVRGE